MVNFLANSAFELDDLVVLNRVLDPDAARDILTNHSALFRAEVGRATVSLAGNFVYHLANPEFPDGPVSTITVRLDGPRGSYAIAEAAATIRELARLNAPAELGQYLFRDDDRILGSDDNDRLYGFAGNDRLEGRGGIDVLYGGAGNDRLNGGSGHSNLFGGPGADTFVFRHDAVVSAIMDFSPDDRLDLIAFDTRFSQLALHDARGDVFIEVPGGARIVIADHHASQLSASDFIF